ncbi:MAG: hypothetical protein J2P58_00440 [Acidimicrobiaceae bacterium]|nr:hypothetical protein [Acidimicrobiaceae bacterium]
MSLFGLLFGFPLLPVRGLVRLGEILQEQAEQEMRSTGSLRAQLEDIAEKRAAGELTEQEEQEAISAVTRRVVDPEAITTELSAGLPNRQEG